MSSTTNPNKCPLCLSPLQVTYHFGQVGRERWTWRCLVCNQMETPAYELVETRKLLLARLATLTRDIASARTALDEMAAKVLAQVDAAVAKATGLDNVAKIQRERDEARTALAEARGVLGDIRPNMKHAYKYGYGYGEPGDKRECAASCYVCRTERILARIDALAGEGGA